MKNKKQTNQGITLIALVITIIVLLILAGVSIAMLTGENGILTQAESADEATKKAEAEEVVDLLLNEWQIERNTKKDASLSQFLTDKVGKEIDKVTPNADGTFTLEKDEYEIKVTADGKRKKDGEITIVEANTEDWSWDEATATITLKEGVQYVSGDNDTLIIPNYCQGKKVKKISSANLYGGTYGFNITAKKIIVSEGIEEIGDYALGYIGAEEIYLPNTLLKIGYAAFGGNSINKLKIPSSVTDISSRAFDNNSNLETVIIPSSVINLSGYVFERCSNVQTINCEALSKPDGWDSNWADGISTDKIHWGVDISE